MNFTAPLVSKVPLDEFPLSAAADGGGKGRGKHQIPPNLQAKPLALHKKKSVALHKNRNMDKVLTVSEMKANFPDQWILVGNPQRLYSDLTAGVVIFHAKEKRDLLECTIKWRDFFASATTHFTGERPKGRRFLL